MLALKEITRHYSALCTRVPLKPIHNDKEYDHAVSVLNQLMDAGAGEETHPLDDLLALLGELIGTYEDARLRDDHSTPADILRFLMEQHGLTQSALPEIGSQGVISELLAGKRSLNLRQIRALADRFGVSPAVFHSGDFKGPKRISGHGSRKERKPKRSVTKAR